MTIAGSFIEAFNQRDVSRMLSCFTPDATYHDLLYGLHDNGEGGLGPLFERMFEEGSDLVWTIDRSLDSSRCEMVEWTFSLTQSESAPRGVGAPVTFRGASVFELRGGLCSAYREHFDKGTVGLAPDAVHRILSR